MNKAVAAEKPSAMEPCKPSKPSDVTEQKTVFIRNLDLDTTEADLAELLRSSFGPLEYCKLVINPYTEKSRGTAFAKFKRREDAQKCLEEDPESAKLYIDGQRLTVTLAVSRDKLEELEQAKHNRHKDKRNLYLAKEGLIYPNSPAAMGVSQADLKKRLQLEEAKRRLLQNLHHFISDRRLCVHNLPPSVTDQKLRAIFQNAVKDRSARILWAKVMCNRAQSGDRKLGKSKGFGFVEFAEHRHALAALRQLNNNPTIFTPERRPIVEFSVENKMALNRKAYRAIKSSRNVKTAAETDGKSSAEEEINEGKKSKKKGRKDRKKNKEKKDVNSADVSKESEEPTFSGVMTKPLLKEDKVVLPKLNRRKIGEGVSELKKRHKALKAEQKKAVNSSRHQKKLKRRMEAAQQAKERREAPEREAPIIDAHFERRKRAFVANDGPNQQNGSVGLPRKKTKWFAK